MTTIHAQEPRDARAPRPPVVESPLDALHTADQRLQTALLTYVEDQIASGAVYAGQYAALNELGCDVVRLLTRWITAPPTGLHVRPDVFRNGCLHAIRDCVVVPSQELKAALAALADDERLEPEGIRLNAVYALAQFGDRTRVETLISRARAHTSMPAAAEQAGGWKALANVYYNLREYDQAVDAHLQLLDLIESGELEFRGHLATRSYNCACALVLAGRTEEGFERLATALEFGKSSGRQLSLRLLQTDMDIAELREDERFRPLLRRYFGIAAELGVAPASDR